MNWYKKSSISRYKKSSISRYKNKFAERKETLSNWIDVWNSIRTLTSKTPNNGIIGNINGITMKLVDGDKVKLQHDIDFVEGGNDKAYDYMPKNEIWIDKNIHSHDWQFICLHEFVEKVIMERDKLSYNEAHKLADEVEKEARLLHS